jgi:hypothetical protein
MIMSVRPFYLFIFFCGGNSNAVPLFFTANSTGQKTRGHIIHQIFRISLFFFKSWIYQKDQGEKCRALGLWKKMKMLVREFFGEKDSI